MVDEPGPAALGGRRGGAGIKEDGPEDEWLGVEDGTMLMICMISVAMVNDQYYWTFDVLSQESSFASPR
jgi:hypothetical protein